MRAGDKVVVLGMAVTGQAVARYLLGAGVQVAAVDDCLTDEARAASAALGLSVADGSRLRAVASGAAAVVVSPGVPAHHPVFSLGVPVISEVELAGQLARDRGIPVVAVTGTNGKTTVTTLVARMLMASGLRAVAAGNIGPPFIGAVAGGADVVVAEVSSFQLALTEAFRPQVGVWLNLAEDHLDWHPSLDHYIAAKARIWAQQGEGDVAVANAEDEVVMDALASVDGHPRAVTFGLAHGDYRVADGRLLDPMGAPIMATAELWRDLPQDRANAVAACAAAQAAGATGGACRSVLATFEGLHHRVELVGQADGVRWYDDSKATTPASVLAALAGFDSVVLIAGGRNKGLDLGVLAQAAGRLRAVVAIGEAAPSVEAAFAGQVGLGGLVEVVRAASMAEAVDAAGGWACPGDAVVLSPGCASFDWYRSYAERGRHFDELVRQRLAGASAGRQEVAG